jgi:hypothetical protein
MKPVLIALALLAAAPVAPQRQATEPTLPFRLTGALISAGGIGNPTGTARVEIRVTRWSTAEERSHLLTTLSQKGQDALLDELKDAKSVGTFRLNTELAWDLRYARVLPQDEGGTRVTLATDRPMSIAEIWNDPRYSRYPFTLIELRFPPEGKPTGSVMLAARVTADNDGRFVYVENFATQPIPISDIEIEHER